MSAAQSPISCPTLRPPSPAELTDLTHRTTQPEATPSGSPLPHPIAALVCPPAWLTDETVQLAGDLHNWAEHGWGAHAARFDLAAARRQWEAMCEAIAAVGVPVVSLERPAATGSRQTPVSLMCGDAALLDGDTAILARTSSDELATLVSLVAVALEARGYSCLQLPEGALLSGGAAAIGEFALFGGWFLRRERLGLTWASRQLARRFVSLRLASDDFDRLDLCLRPLRPEIALCVPEAFDAAGFRQLQEHMGLLLPVPVEEARRGGCGPIVLGRTVLLPTGCPTTAALLDAAGFTVQTLELSQFTQLGASPAGLVLLLNR